MLDAQNLIQMNVVECELVGLLSSHIQTGVLHAIIKLVTTDTKSMVPNALRRQRIYVKCSIITIIVQR